MIVRIDENQLCLNFDLSLMKDTHLRIRDKLFKLKNEDGTKDMTS